jgi:hypothetical protein
MGAHNKILKRLDLMRECSALRMDAPKPWTCIGCGQHHDAKPFDEVQDALLHGQRVTFEDVPIHAEIMQENGVILNVCGVCLLRAAAKDNDTFRTIYPGEFEPHKITDKQRRAFYALCDGYRDSVGGAFDAILDLYKVKSEDGENFLDKLDREMEATNTTKE